VLDTLIQSLDCHLELEKLNASSVTARKSPTEKLNWTAIVKM
jgi:hypothetical protein